jgi:hypothetical protein
VGDAFVGFCFTETNGGPAFRDLDFWAIDIGGGGSWRSPVHSDTGEVFAGIVPSGGFVGIFLKSGVGDQVFGWGLLPVSGREDRDGQKPKNRREEMVHQE